MITLCNGTTPYDVLFTTTMRTDLQGHKKLMIFISSEYVFAASYK